MLRGTAAGQTSVGLALGLGLEPHPHRLQARLAQDQPPQLRLGRGVFQHHQDLAGLDLFALAHLDLPDHAAVGVLDDLVLAGGDEMPSGHDSAGHQRRAGPGAERQQEDAEQNGAQPGRSPARPGNRSRTNPHSARACITCPFA